METIKSIQEVNAKIPELKKVFEKISELNEKSLSLSRDIQDLFDIWGDQITDEKNMDFALYQEKLSKKNAVGRAIQSEIKKVDELGGVVKDIQKGLVDFYIEHDGGGIYLCWKIGEDKVSHWHPIRGGFTARRPLEELFPARA